MSTPQATDTILVERSGTSYKTEYDKVGALPSLLYLWPTNPSLGLNNYPDDLQDVLDNGTPISIGDYTNQNLVGYGLVTVIYSGNSGQVYDTTDNTNGSGWTINNGANPAFFNSDGTVRPSVGGSYQSSAWTSFQWYAGNGSTDIPLYKCDSNAAYMCQGLGNNQGYGLNTNLKAGVVSGVIAGTLLKTDTLLIERSGTNYKSTWADAKGVNDYYEGGTSFSGTASIHGPGSSIKNVFDGDISAAGSFVIDGSAASPSTLTFTNLPTYTSGIEVWVQSTYYCTVSVINQNGSVSAGGANQTTGTWVNFGKTNFANTQITTIKVEGISGQVGTAFIAGIKMNGVLLTDGNYVGGKMLMSDLLLMNRGTTSYKIAASDFTDFQSTTTAKIHARFQNSSTENTAANGTSLTYINGVTPTLANAATNSYGITKVMPYSTMGKPGNYMPATGFADDTDYSYDLVFYYDGSPTNSAAQRLIGTTNTYGMDVYMQYDSGNGITYLRLKGGLKQVSLGAVDYNPRWYHLRLCNKGDWYLNGTSQGTAWAGHSNAGYDKMDAIGPIGMTNQYQTTLSYLPTLSLALYTVYPGNIGAPPADISVLWTSEPI